MKERDPESAAPTGGVELELELEPGGAAGEPRIDAPRIGWVAGLEAGGALLVDFAGNAGGAVAALSTVALDARAVAAAVATRQRALLVFAEGDPRRPVLMGLIHPGASLVDQVLEAGSAAPAPPPAPEALVDGRRVVLEGAEEVVLRCGEASITLRANGKIVVRGAYVETYATGVNRIKGGAVRIN